MDEQGSFDFTVDAGIGLGVSILQLHQRTYYDESVGALAPGERRTIRIALPRYRAIYLGGRILAPDGFELDSHSGDVEVTASRAGESFSKPTSGPVFVFGFVPEGDYTLVANPFGIEGMAPSNPVIVDGSEERIALRLRRAGSMSVNLLRTSEPFASFQVGYLREGDTTWTEKAADADPLVLKNLSPGTYNLAAWGDRKFGMVNGIVVAEGEAATDVQVTLREAGFLSFNREGAEPGWYTISIDGRFVSLGSLEGGTFILVPPGILEIVTRLNSETEDERTQFIDVQRGEISIVDTD